MNETVSTIENLIIDYSKETNVPLEHSEFTLWIRPVWCDVSQATNIQLDLVDGRYVAGFVIIVVFKYIPNNLALYVDAEYLLVWDLHWRLGNDRYILSLDCDRVPITEKIGEGKTAYSKSTIIKVNGKLTKESVDEKQ
jgi:hypothetical protein